MQCSITFDDGPTVPETEAILDILLEYSVFATFFVIGERAVQYPGIVRRMYREGHAIGNHTYSHSRLTILSDDNVRNEILRAQEELKRILPEEPRLFRAPYGQYDSRTNIICEQHNLEIVTWDVDSSDWECASDDIVQNVLGRAGKYSTILFHVKPQTVQALPLILDALREKGLV